MIDFPPAGANILWYAPIITLVFSVVYSATRYESWHFIWTRALLWFLRIALFLGGVAGFIYFVSLQWHKMWYAVTITAILVYIYFPRSLIRLVRRKLAKPTP